MHPASQHLLQDFLQDPSQNSPQDWSGQLTALAGAMNDTDTDGAHDINHLHRVWQTARILLDDYPDADTLVVQAACYLHDLVNLPKDNPQRHLASRQSAQLARKHLQRLDFPMEKLDAVVHAIEAHSFSAGITPTTIEAQIVQDADRLDALGAVGLARMFYTAGRMGSQLAHANDARAEHRTPDDRRYALDHIVCKLETLPATMQTEAGRRLGEQRVQWLRDFRMRFLEEWEGA